MQNSLLDQIDVAFQPVAGDWNNEIWIWITVGVHHSGHLNRQHRERTAISLAQRQLCHHNLHLVFAAQSVHAGKVVADAVDGVVDHFTEHDGAHGIGRSGQGVGHIGHRLGKIDDGFGLAVTRHAIHQRIGNGRYRDLDDAAILGHKGIFNLGTGFAKTCW